MVKLARNEQCITLYPLTARYSVGPFPAHVIFRPSQSPFILGLISSIRLLTARYCHFLLVGQIQPVVTVGPFVARTLGRFDSVIKIRPINDGPLWSAHEPTIPTLARLRP